MRELQAHERTIDERRLAPGDAVITRLWRQLLEDCEVFGGTLFVAVMNDTVVGYTGVLTRVRSEDPEDADYQFAQVTDLVVREAFRAQGIGSALLRRAREHARASGAHWLRINVLAGNAGVAELYRRCGFHDRELVLEQDLR